MKLGIIGHGFVGKAVDYGFHSCDKIIIDPLYGNDIEELENERLDVTFVCVPTPMGEDGSIDSSIVEKTVRFCKRKVSGLIVVKSTVTPDIVEKLQGGMAGDRVIYNPEFLTEKNAQEDFINPQMHIFGGVKEKTRKLSWIYKEYSLCKPCPVYHMSGPDASLLSTESIVS